MDTLTPLRIKWGRNEGKILTAHFKLRYSQLSRFGSSFQNFILNVVCDTSK